MIRRIAVSNLVAGRIIDSITQDACDYTGISAIFSAQLLLFRSRLGVKAGLGITVAADEDPVGTLPTR